MCIESTGRVIQGIVDFRKSINDAAQSKGHHSLIKSASLLHANAVRNGSGHESR